MKKRHHPSALALVAATLASIFQPPVVMAPSAWAQKHVYVADGPRAGDLWDPTLTPQLVPVLDALTPGSSWNKVVLRKSAQIGATQIGISWLALIIAAYPARVMVVFPTTNAVQEYAREKLSPAIAASPELRKRVRSDRKSSNRGSTTLTKVFTGGSISLIGANSPSDLSSKTVKFAHFDETDRWPAKLEGQGDPMALAEARFISFHSSGDYLAFWSSTPTLKGVSRIDEEFEKGTQNFWHVACPHCGHEQRLVFGGGKDTVHGLKFNREPPYQAHYICIGNGCVIEQKHQRAMVAAGRFIPLNADKGLFPSFHIDSLTSLLTTWDHVADAFWRAKRENKLQEFVNLWLGESWEERGEAPEWELLLLRREAYATGVLPVGALVLTMGVDVQGNGLFYEVVGWGADGQSWSIDAGFLPGDTAAADGQVWRDLTALSERRYPDAYGNAWPVDQIGVDAGFNTEAVKAWVRGRPKAKALKGQPGWYGPPIGTPAKTDVTIAGVKRTRGALVWPVTGWPLKAKLYADLRKMPPTDGSELYQPGYVHLAAHNDERFCRQLVAETLKDRMVKGRLVKEWIAPGDNHFHDCRIYNMALHEHMGCPRWSAEEWKEMSRMRGVRPDSQREMFTVAPEPVKPASVVSRPQALSPVTRPRSGGFVNGWKT